MINNIETVIKKNNEFCLIMNTLYYQDFLNILKSPKFSKLIKTFKFYTEKQDNIFKYLLLNLNEYTVLSNKEDILKLIYFLNEFKDYKISYKKDLLNFNPNNYFKSFKFRNLYMINLFSVNKPYNVSNASDTLNNRYFIIKNKLYNEYKDFINNNSFFYLDIETSYIYNKDKYQLKTINNHKEKYNQNFNNVNFDLLLEKIYYYIDLNQVKFNQEKFNLDNDYIMYLLDKFYTYEYNQDLNIKINFVIEFLKYLDLNNLITIEFKDLSLNSTSYTSDFIQNLIKNYNKE